MRKHFLFYFMYFILNIIFFSFLSIYMYQLLCGTTTTFSFLNSSNNKLFYDVYYFFSIKNNILQTNSYCFNSITISYNIFFYNSIYFFYIMLNYISTIYLLEFDLNYFLLYNNIFKIYFFTKSTSTFSSSINFECLQNIIYLYPNETSLIFFRLESNCNVNLICLTIYIVYPLKLTFLVNKLQCFCFSNVVVHPHELIELPVLFFVNNFFSFSEYKLYIFYLLLIL